MEAGRVIGGKYRLRREIGKGAMGSVWAAVHESLGRSVAVKFLRPTTVNHETASARFVAEARMAAAVKHRFVVDIFDFGITEDGISYMVLDLLEGDELGERMYYGPPMLVHDAVKFVCQCLSGLEAVHEAGIVHRDLKPENIFIIQDAEGQFPTLLDFGISKMDADAGTPNVSLRPPRMGGWRAARLTLPGTVIGTPWYMAPEQLRGSRSIDARADVFGIGVILWEWLVGRVPYDHDNIGDLLVNLLKHGPPNLFAVRPELGQPLSDVLTRAMATIREERVQTARELRESLQAVVDELPQAWTVVQKSIAEMTSAEVLGVRFPSEAPTRKQTESFAPEPKTAVDDLMSAIIASAPVPPTSPIPGLPVPPPAAGASGDAAPYRPWGALTERAWGWLSAPPHRLRAFSGIVLMSVVLLVAVAVFSGKEPPPDLPPPGEVLMPSAAAQPDTGGRDRTSAQEVTPAPNEHGEASAEAEPGGTNDPEGGDYLPTEMPDLSFDEVGQVIALDANGSDEAGAQQGATKTDKSAARKRRRSVRRRAKRKRLYRSLDF